MSRRPDERGRKVAAPPETPEIAVSLARIGWPVFPVTIYEDASGKRHKVPAVKWKAEATTDEKVVAKWFAGEHSGRWIGVYAGAAGEDGIVVLDVDPGGDDSIAEAGFDVPPTFNYPTHRAGGRHHVYAAPKGVNLTIAKGLLPGVDVRSGAGLMVYYGPKLKKAPKLAPAPAWILVESDRPRDEGGSGALVDPSATELGFRERLHDSKPKGKLARLVRGVEFPKGAAHEPMLEVVAALVSEGVKGTPGVLRLLDETRERYVVGGVDRARDWDNAIAGSVKRFGLPPVSFEISKSEKKAIAARNAPEAIEKREKARKAVYRAERHKSAIEKASDPDDHDRPDPGSRVLEDAPLADELAKILSPRWAYSRGLGLMRYDGRVWQSAEEHSIIEAVRRLLVEIEVDEHTVAAMRGDNKAIDKARGLLSRSRAAAVARLVVGILAEAEPVFDAHPDLINTPSGVVDLRTGELQPHDPQLYFTKITGAPYDPDADRTMWNRAAEALPPKVAAWLQVRMGQAITGYTPDDDVLTIFEGAGENGKTGWMIGFRKAIGDYGRTLPERLLVADPGDHPTTLMTLFGARAGVIEELPEGRSLNVKRLKDTVGTPEITARKMRQDDVTFPNTTALFLATNYLPIVAETDHGTWRRLALVRFRLTYVKSKKKMTSKRHRLGDPAVKRYFEHNADPGLLAWLVEGARLWYARGQKMPPMPKIVEKDTAAWRLDADPILAYARERIVRDESFAIPTTDLADDFNQWLERRGHRRWTSQTINSRFGGHVSFDGVERKMCKWSGVLRPSRPGSILSTKPIPKTTTAWRGVRFVEEPRIPSEAELDAATLADLDRRASA